MNLLNSKLFNETLPLVIKPARYIGNEYNSIHKDLTKVEVKVALAFPDIYDIAMSHLGLKILYDIINQNPDWVAERVFAPWIDMESELRKNNIPLYTLESFTPLNQFDIIGFSLQHELSYTNVLNMLDLAGIPVFAKDRNQDYPLIIAGGPCCYNPEPMAEFIDAFVIGDGEEVILELINAYLAIKRNRKSRENILLKLAEIEGVYVPIVHNPSNSRIKRRTVDLEKAPYPIKQIVPFIETVHDRAAIEIQRGCTRGCRFCQTGFTTRPRQERTLSTIVRLAEETLSSTGFTELSLLSLSTTDYSGIQELVKQLIGILELKKIALSLPSLRVDSFSVELAQQIQKIRKTGFTFAIEAGSERLRNVINKPISEMDCLNTVEQVFSAGWQLVKLYFMLGLPTETEEDLKQMVELLNKIAKLAKSAPVKNAKINVAISPFVPKPHTPFQWLGQLPIDKLHQRILWLDNQLKHTRLDLKWHEIEQSYLEAVFARGDCKLGSVIYTAWKKGSKFDSWTDQFLFNSWLDAFRECELNPDDYALRSRELEERLPWEHIDIGVTPSFLKQEYIKSLASEITPDCRIELCNQCGIIDCPTTKMQTNTNTNFTKTAQFPVNIAKLKMEQVVAERWKMRIKFAKHAPIRFISHLDLMKTIISAMHRAGLPIAYSQGFNPQPRLSFANALSLGYTSIAEYFECEISKYLPPQEFQVRLLANLPIGIELLDSWLVPFNAPMLSSLITTQSYRIFNIPNDITFDDLMKRTKQILSEKEIIIQRQLPDKLITTNIRPYISKIDILNNNENKLEIILYLTILKQGSAKPTEIMSLLINTTGDIIKQLLIERTGIYYKVADNFIPLDRVGEKLLYQVRETTQMME